MTSNAALEYGPAQPNEIETLAGLLEQALTFPLNGMAPWIELLGHENVRSVRRDGRVVAGAGIMPMGHYFGGVSVPTAGITAVGVAPDQRASGVGVWMIRKVIEESRQLGFPLASLYPATTTFYRRSGFERAATRTIYEVPLATLGVRDTTLEAIPVGDAERAIVKDLFARKAAQSSGFIDRPGFYWERIFSPNNSKAYSFIVQRDGVPEGYVIFNHASWGEPLNVRDLVALTPAAGRRILTLLADHRSMIETLRFPGAPNDPFLFLMAEQKQKIYNILDLMLRIVDLPAALAARGYLPDIQVELHLDVADDLLPHNNGRFVLRVADGHGTVEPGGSGQLQLHIRDLAALYSGFFSASDLAAAGTLSGETHALATASLIFSGPRPWLADMF